MGTKWDIRNDAGTECDSLSQRDPIGSPLTKTDGSPLGIPNGSHIASQMGPLWVPVGMSGRVIFCAYRHGRARRSEIRA